jgi:hypothetical protein
MALGSTQPLTEMSTRKFPGGKKRLACKADNLATIYKPNVWKCRSLNLSFTFRRYVRMPGWNIPYSFQNMKSSISLYFALENTTSIITILGSLSDLFVDKWFISGSQLWVSWPLKTWICPLCWYRFYKAILSLFSMCPSNGLFYFLSLAALQGWSGSTKNRIPVIHNDDYGQHGDSL